MELLAIRLIFVYYSSNEAKHEICWGIKIACMSERVILEIGRSRKEGRRKMKYQKKISFFNNMKYVLEEDSPEVGWYVLVYEGDLCVKDYLQDNLTMAIDFAYEEFGVPKDSWSDFEDE